jgi:predicted nucleic acid-binding Zn ribbon protein
MGHLAANRVTTALLGALGPTTEPPRWNRSTCANCDRPLPVTGKPQTFCSDACRAVAHEIRELRRQRAAGLDTALQTQSLKPEARNRVESAIPVRGCDAEDWATFIQWFQDADQS